MIAGALVTAVKSDWPGDVIATVTEQVYDTATGKFLLIPQGSRILGKYNSQVSYGQSRVQVWPLYPSDAADDLTRLHLSGSPPPNQRNHTQSPPPANKSPPKQDPQRAISLSLQVQTARP